MEVNDWIYNRILKKNITVYYLKCYIFLYITSQIGHSFFLRGNSSIDLKYLAMTKSMFIGLTPILILHLQIFQPDQNKLCLIFGMSLLLIFFFFWSVLLRIFCTCIWPYLCRHLSEATPIAFLTHLITFNHNQKNK